MKKRFSPYIIIASLGVCQLSYADDHDSEGVVKNVSGFIDAQAVLTNEADQSTFQLNDGAVYFELQTGDTSFFVDLPMSGGAEDGSNDIAFGEEKAQLYFTHSVLENLQVTFGQFDMIIGFEDNDSIGNFFSNTTEFVGGPFGNTHTGVMLTSEIGGFEVSSVLSNPTDSGSLGDVEAEYGLVISNGNDNFETYFGFVNTDVNDDNGASLGTQSLAEFGMEYSNEGSTITAQMYYFDPAEEGLESGWGAFTQYFYRTSEQLELGVRLEKVSDIDGVDDGKALSVGLNYTLNDNLLIKVDGTYKDSQIQMDDDSESILRLSSIYSF